MGAVVSVNGHALVVAKDQFLRYIVPLPARILTPGAHNTLTVAFSNAIDVNGRFMACTGACALTWGIFFLDPEPLTRPFPGPQAAGASAVCAPPAG